MSLKYVCHYGEIGLKGRNRNLFVRILKNNIRRSLRKFLGIRHVTLYSRNSRILLEIEDEADRYSVNMVLERIFGIAHFSPIDISKPDMEEMKETAVRQLKDKEFKTFAVKTRRSNKRFPLISEEVNKEVGQAILDIYQKKVNLKHPEMVSNIEILDKEVFIYNERREGPGGLPVGVNGNVLVLLSAGLDSPVAAYFIMKRGARCHFVHFHSHPFTDRRSQEKVRDLIQQLHNFQFGGRLFSVPFAETQKEIVFKCPEPYRIVLYRRFMMRIAEKLADHLNIPALVTGESLGQVASQTLENLRGVEQVTQLPILRPLIGMDKNEIISVARKIGTYDISKLAHDDVCTRFMPENPVIRSRLGDIKRAESELDIDEFVTKGMTEMVEVQMQNH